MADPNLRDFYGRIYRIRKSHSRGGGFEAAGTLGRAYFIPQPARSLRLGRMLRPLLLLIVAVTILKAAILTEIGPQAYAARLATLQKGDALDRIGALIMVADPATSFIAAKVAGLRG